MHGRAADLKELKLLSEVTRRMVAESWEYLRRSRVATRQLELQMEEIREKCERARAAMQSFPPSPLIGAAAGWMHLANRD
jgi:hypothetical protein